MRDTGRESDAKSDWETQTVPSNAVEYDLTGLLPGEKYQIQFFSSSFKVESQAPLEVVEILGTSRELMNKRLIP